ncbi:MAG: xanthine dehydrogenase family protein molybdopterin-binding subunit [Dokdonella sp.]
MPASSISRRDFLKVSASTLGGLVVAFMVPGAGRFAFAQEPAKAAKLPPPNAFLRIGRDDRVSVILAHSEMGQGVWTTLSMLLAEELDADWSKISAEHAPAAPVYFHTLYGVQMTGGSTTTASEFDRYRQAGALARALLIQAAANRHGVAVADIRTEPGVVIAGQHRMRFGELADEAAKLSAPETIALKDASNWRFIGKPTKRLDTPAKLDGSAKFGIDTQFDGLLTAMVARSPTFGGKVVSFDASMAKAMPGVRDVVQVPSGIAVIADHYWAAKVGRDALKINWDAGALAQLDSPSLNREYRELASTAGQPALQKGDAADQLTKPSKSVSAEFSVPYLAHATMEPLNCAVRIGKDSCEIWTGTQFQTGDQAAAAGILGLKPEQVSIHTTFLGGGFGRRANPVSDFVSEAVHVAKAAGKPVKVIWSREDDMHGGYYRPAFVHAVKVSLDNKGMPVAWQHRAVGQSILLGTPFEAMMKDGIDPSSVEGVVDSPYLQAMADVRVDVHTPKTGVPVLWWRSVGHTHTAFVMESMIDELAHAAGKDPVAYRRTLLTDHPRHLGVLNLAAEKSGWGKPLAKGHSRGIAVHESFGSFVAQVADISVVENKIRVHHVTCAIDCGIAVNPSGIEAQVESAIAFGLTAALYGEVTLKDGRVEQSNFNDYRVLRINEMPVVEVHIVPSKEHPSGVGEPGTPPIAPAVANALFALTGKRSYELPFKVLA